MKNKKNIFKKNTKQILMNKNHFVSYHLIFRLVETYNII
jgi:hypothetical protein